MTDKAEPKIDLNDPEVVLVAGGLIAPALAAEAAQFVQDEDFFDARLRLIWTTVMKVLKDGVAPADIDVVTIAAKCARSPATQRKIAMYAGELLDAFPKITSLTTLAQRVHRRATMRMAIERMRAIATDIKEQLEAPGGDVEDMEARIAQLSLEISARQDKANRRVVFKDMFKEVSLYFDNLSCGPSPSTIPTGIATLDRRLGGGMRRGQLHAILGCTGSGKTALASQICDHAESLGQKALLFSMEVDAVDVFIRDVERTAGRSRWDLRSHQEATREAALDAIVHAEAKMMNNPSKIIYGEPVTIEGIRQVILTEFARGVAVGVVVVDHAQVALPSQTQKRGMPRYLEVKDVAESLRNMARQLNVAVVLTAQMNPPPKGEKPTMALVREGKDITNIAEVVLVIWHEKEELSDGKVHLTDSYIYAEKVRAGQAGKVKVSYNGSIFRFADAWHHEDEEGESGASD